MIPLDSPYFPDLIEAGPFHVKASLVYAEGLHRRDTGWQSMIRVDKAGYALTKHGMG